MKKISLLFVAIIMIFLSTFVNATSINPMAVAKYETESNNTRATANVVEQDETVYGTISSSSDVDYFKVVFPMSGKANFWLGNIPSGKDYDLYVYNSSGGLLASATGTSTAELVSRMTVTANTTYYFKVVGVDGDYDSINQYKVRCKLLLNTYNYYCQSTPSLSNPRYDLDSNGNEILSKLYNSNGTSWISRINSAGCFDAAYSMLLRNRNIKSSKSVYDFRNGTTGLVNADLFTLAYVCCGRPTITANSNGTYTAQTTKDPVIFDLSAAKSYFGFTRSKYDLSGLSDKQKADAIAYQLTLHPEGVLVEYQSGSKRHTIVFTETTHETSTSYTFPTNISLTSIDDSTEYEYGSFTTEEDIEMAEYMYANKLASIYSTNYDGSFTVYDPAIRNSQTGEGILFSDSCTAYVYGFSNAVNMCVIDY